MVNIVHLLSIGHFLKQDISETKGLKGDNVFTLMVSKQHSVVCFLSLNKRMYEVISNLIKLTLLEMLAGQGVLQMVNKR